MSNLDVLADIAIATYEDKKRTPTSSIVDRHFLLNRLKEKGRIKTHTGGGTQLTQPLVLGENQTIQNIYGGQKINLGASNVAAQLNMGWSEKVMVVQVSQRELDVNKGKERIFDFAEMLMDAASDTAGNRMGVEMYSDGSGYESLYGIPSFVTSSGAGDYGGVSVAAWPRWQTQVEVLPGGYTSTQLVDALDSAVIKATDGVEKPDLCVASVKHWKLLAKELRSKTYFNDPGYMKESRANLNWNVISHGNLDVQWDQNSLFGLDIDVSYLLCTDHIFIEELDGAQWQFDKGVRPIDSFQKVMLARWMGAMYTDKRRCHAIIRT
jgi:hypothetical protein